jgi:penicillin amidase
VRRTLAVFLVLAAGLAAETVRLPGLTEPVEILRDRWGVPHIYARNTPDLFFAQGYIAARDRLWQIDWWRRVGAGKLAEVLGPSAVERDRLARAVRFRGDWEAEWRMYHPEGKAIAKAFTDGINAYIRSLNGRRPPEFARAGYDPGLWVPEDCAARMAGLVMVRNVTRELARARDIQRFGLDKVQQYLPPDPYVKITVPAGLDLADITPELVAKFSRLLAPPSFTATQGSNNWVVDGTLTTTGKPLLASDPHRPVIAPSLRKTVHLVAPGWNAIGAGEPALPGIALGHNERIGFGFTIVGIDQADLYVERLNSKNLNQYFHRGQWREMEIVRETVQVKGGPAQTIELKFTAHGPVFHEDHGRQRAYALKWTGALPGGAGYLAALATSQAKNWTEFRRTLENYIIPSENIVYGDVDGNIGWQPVGLAPIRSGWTGLLPVPGHTGEFEWSGFRKLDDLPRTYNPPQHFVGTANHNILPKGYTIPLSYEWAAPFRYLRVHEMLSTAREKFSVADFERMQQDVVSVPARRLQGILKRWPGERPKEVEELLAWNAELRTDSRAALLYEAMAAHLPEAVFGKELGSRVDLQMTLSTLEDKPDPAALGAALKRALAEMERRLGKDRAQWTWGRLHQISFAHPVLGAMGKPVPRPGDGNTVNSTSGGNFRQTNGASYRHILDFSDWDKSVMTNVPGESGDPSSKHYADLINDWAAGRYHPMPYTRKAVEAATAEKIQLEPARP